MSKETNLGDAFGLNDPGIPKLQPRTRTEPEAEHPVDVQNEDHSEDLFEEDDLFDDEETNSDHESNDIDAFPVGVYLVPDTARRIAHVRRETRKQNAEIAMDAIDLAHRRGRLAKLIEKRSTVVKRPKGSLFPSRRGQGRRAADTERRKLWTFQATKKEQDILLDLVEQFGAASMSELVAVTLEARYGPKPSRSTSPPKS